MNEYVSREVYTHFDDTPLRDEFQDEVYLSSYLLAISNHCRKIGDIGCGSGFKLLKYFPDFETFGFEIEPTLSFLRKTYPHKNWMESQFDQPTQISFDVLICSDVIEHLVNPDDLLNWIDQIDFKYLVISTPDRDLIHLLWADDLMAQKQTQSGPPVNPAHVREWNFEEFETYLGKYFDIIEHFHPQKEIVGQILVAAKKASK